MARTQLYACVLLVGGLTGLNREARRYILPYFSSLWGKRRVSQKVSRNTCLCNLKEFQRQRSRTAVRHLVEEVAVAIVYTRVATQSILFFWFVCAFFYRRNRNTDSTNGRKIGMMNRFPSFTRIISVQFLFHSYFASHITHRFSRNDTNSTAHPKVYTVFLFFPLRS